MKANFIPNFHQIIDESTISVNYPKFLLTACLRVIRISFVWKSKQEDDSKMLRGLRSNNPLLVKGVTDVPFGPVSKRLLAQEPYKTWYRIDCASIFQLVVGWGFIGEELIPSPSTSMPEIIRFRYTRRCNRTRSSIQYKSKRA